MITVLLFGVGVCLGSFVNALVWRLYKQNRAKPKKQINKYSILRGRSMCVHCEHQLAWIDLIPVVSWLTLKGKCRYCRKPISWQYPAVELSLAMAFAISYLAWPYAWDSEGIIRFLFWLPALVLMAGMFLYDLKWMKLPTVLLFSLIGLGVLQTIIVGIISHDFTQTAILAVAAVGIGGGLFYVIYIASRGKAIGDGDATLGYGYGLILGVPLLSFMTILVGSILGSFVAFSLIISGKAKASTKVPFGPFLILGTFFAALWGQWLWDKIGVWFFP